MLAKRSVTLLVLLSLASVVLVSGCGGAGEEQDPKALMANPWQVTKYVDVNGRLVPPLATEKPGAVGLTIEFTTLERTDWVCTGYNNGQEAFVSIVADTEITARFEEGVLSGSAGVNNYNGKYTVDGAKLSIDSAIASTMIAGEPEAMDQESAYLATLPDVVSYKIQDNILTLYGAGGLRLVTYVPAP